MVRLFILGGEYHRSLSIIKEYMMLIYLINGNVNFDQSVKVVSARFLHCWIMNFSFTISNIMGRYFETVHLVYFLSNLHRPILASISGPFLQQLLLWYFSGNFLFSSFTCTNWSSARKSCPSPSSVFPSFFLYVYKDILLHGL